MSNGVNVSRVQIRAKLGCAESLRPIAQKVRAYFEAHPLPSGAEASGEIVQCESERWVSYEWDPSIPDAPPRAAWQALFDAWMQKNFSGRLPRGISAIVVSFKDEARLASDESCAEKSGFIKGAELAEFHSVQPRHRIADLIVSNGVMRSIMSALAIIRHADLIYRQWGFEDVESVRRTVLNFYGPPGTGKTMAAHCIAHELGKKIVIANFAEIESKYVGDSPKNLENIFRCAYMDDSVLFFDEADSFLGTRITKISSSSDQAVNSLRSKLLQLLEDHSGVVIFCTNLLKNYDKAFESRILSNIKFELPDHDCRKRLIRQKIPTKVPFREGEVLEDEDLSRLADICDGLSGREIKNAVLRTLCLAAHEGRTDFLLMDFADGFEQMQDQVRQLQEERGELSEKRRADISAIINDKLTKGNYVTAREKEKDV